MKKELKHCSTCGEDTWHMIGKKLSSKGKSDKHHIKRTTSHCTKCNKRDIVNSRKRRMGGAGGNL